jgi:pyridoxal phosphate enzyme (YggS family)
VTIADRLTTLEQHIRAACDRAGRERSAVTLVAVSKTRPPETVIEVARAGITDVGENRVQEAAVKKPLASGPNLTWHLIGHLQTNKAKKTVELFDIVESVDSVRLAAELQRRCEQADRRLPVLAEVNTSGEASKFGASPTDVPELLRELVRFDRLELLGLMTIGPGWAIDDPEASRACFRELRGLNERARQDLGLPLPALSMGMSSDFAVGIEEGATIIRIGTAIFGPRT